MTMATAAEAAAAIEGLGGRYTWDGMDGPMVGGQTSPALVCIRQMQICMRRMHM